MVIIHYYINHLCNSESTTFTSGICSRQAGHRFGENVERVVPSLVQFISVDDDELREFCLQAFEALVTKCPKEMAPHIGTLTNICLELLAYDPNYNYEVYNYYFFMSVHSIDSDYIHSVEI